MQVKILCWLWRGSVHAGHLAWGPRQVLQTDEASKTTHSSDTGKI